MISSSFPTIVRKFDIFPLHILTGPSTWKSAPEFAQKLPFFVLSVLEDYDQFYNVQVSWDAELVSGKTSALSNISIIRLELLPPTWTVAFLETKWRYFGDAE